MTPTVPGLSPRSKARIAGVIYLACGMMYSFARNDVRGTLVVFGDAAATAHNILAHEPLFRLGFAAEILSAVCYVVVALLLYDLFKPVNRSVSMLAAFFSLAGPTSCSYRPRSPTLCNPRRWQEQASAAAAGR